ncbi:MAG: hypothetical protein CVT90_02440 [Candidatus Altiarchaeales archaeon HGW-Altiarchaeales-3]|nr:MAG: hypothetical protein CVT90_02440 [Candidatus Altiarchaeales archaeon HGW-Altiarchaeales-3]
MSELEELKKKKMQELMRQQSQQQIQSAMQQQYQEREMDDQLKMIMNQILMPEAQERMANIRLANIDFARQVEVMLIQLYQAGRLPQKLTDPQLKEILMKLQSSKREPKIIRR